MRSLIAALLITYPSAAHATPTAQDTNRYAQIGAALVAGTARKQGDRALECAAARDLQFYQDQDPSTPPQDQDWVAGIIIRTCR